MAQVKALILKSAGTNCDMETAYAFELAGAQADCYHVNRLIEEPAILKQYQVMAIPGGFSYGDDIAAGRILANQLVHHFHDEVKEFIHTDKLVIGICNGFQVLVKAGLLPALEEADGAGRQQATITHNDSARYEDRWVYLEPKTDRCVFIDQKRRIYLPVAHGEGKVCFETPEVLDRLKAAGQVAFQYVNSQGQSGGYPVNPNGSTDHIAGLCDPTGRVLGLMPHPERFVHRTNHPRWTREAIEKPDGLTLFENAVNYFN